MTLEQDELLASWLEAMHPRLSRFEDFITPREWSGGYTRESLVSLERYILDRWPDKKAFIDENDTDFIDGSTRYARWCTLRRSSPVTLCPPVTEMDGPACPACVVIPAVSRCSSTGVRFDEHC